MILYNFIEVLGGQGRFLNILVLLGATRIFYELLGVSWSLLGGTSGSFGKIQIHIQVQIQIPLWLRFTFRLRLRLMGSFWELLGAFGCSWKLSGSYCAPWAEKLV